MPKCFRLIFIGIVFLTIPLSVRADVLLEKRDFSVDPAYDSTQREKTTAVLQRFTNQLYFYLDNVWWDSLTIEKQKEVNIAINDLAQEFENNIYPVLTKNFGSEWKPGIDNDEKITILIHPMTEKTGGYFSPGDEYYINEVPKSNQREMIYLNSEHITNSFNKIFLAHEFSHLINFNQKDRTYGVSEETWLNEARAEYVPTLLNYDKVYQGTNLQKRIEQFLGIPRDSLTEWQGKSSDYGVLNIFTQYLVEKYGFKILTDSLKSDKTGINSINYALQKNGFKEDMSRIFIDWTVTVFLNDCAVSTRYCYLNENLRGLKITPYIYFLPTADESSLSVGYLTKEWAGNWQKIININKSLKLEFTGGSKVNFRVPYIIEYSDGKYEVRFLELDKSKKGTVQIKNGNVASLIIIPSVQEKITGFSDKESLYQFSWTVSAEKSDNENGNSENPELIKNLQARIQDLKAQLADLRAQLATLAGKSVSCGRFENNLYYGMKGNADVSCLQKFLAEQSQEIYPEGLVTGNFLSLTRTAVIRFQEKYAADILIPLGLEKGTGFVGKATIAKLNAILEK